MEKKIEEIDKIDYKRRVKKEGKYVVFVLIKDKKSEKDVKK